MSNVFSIGWRIPCPGLRASSNSLLSAPVTFRPAVLSSCFRELPARRLYSSSRRFVSPLGLGSSTSPRTSFPAVRPAPSLLSRSVKTKSTPAPKRKEPVENGVPISSKPLSTKDINRIFGPNKVSPALGNRILSVLQGRRINGTLDLDLPSDIIRSARPSVIDAGLQWLRQNHPVDEDAAILARIEKEEQEEEEKFKKQAEEMGLYKPQSGHYGAELGKANDPWGKSVLQEYREKNEARLLAEQEQKRKEWLEGEAKDYENITKALKRNTELQKYEEAAVVEARPRADPSERPLLAWIQKHHLRATNNEIDTSNMTNARRILPALGVTLLTLGLCYVFAETYSLPVHKDRMWKDIPPAAATVIGIIGLNLGVFTLWKFWPPAWRMLNKYFISVPIYPHALSVVGSIFSHQQVKHLATNMLILWFIGTRLHDEIGRGNFISLFLASGVIGSFTSLSAHVLTKQLTVTSLGASGAIAGLVAAWCMLHADDQLTLWFLPREWQDTISARGSVFLAGIVLFEAISLVTPFRVAALDHWAHLGGYLTGAAWATFWKAKKEKERKKRREELSWVGKLFSE